jgi:hypothetical protein
MYETLPRADAPYRPSDHLSSRNGNLDRPGVAHGVGAERREEQTVQPLRPVFAVAEDPGTWGIIGESAGQHGRQ